MNPSEIKELAAKLPAGPWGWFGGEYDFYLATRHSGRQYILGFARRGMRGAQPVFRTGHTMADGVDLAQFAVGEQSIVGFDAAKKDGSVYRYDIRGFDNDVARWFAAIDPTTVTDLATKAEAAEDTISKLTEALEQLRLSAEAVLKSWDERGTERERFVSADEAVMGHAYWSPTASLVSSEAMAGLRAALSLAKSETPQ